MPQSDPKPTTMGIPSAEANEKEISANPESIVPRPCILLFLHPQLLTSLIKLYSRLILQSTVISYSTLTLILILFSPHLLVAPTTSYYQYPIFKFSLGANPLCLGQIFVVIICLSSIFIFVSFPTRRQAITSRLSRFFSAFSL